MTYSERHLFLVSDVEQTNSEIRVENQLASGHGGQKVNKTSSSVRITHIKTGLTVRCMESRSQSVNKKIAIRKLKFLIAVSVRISLDEYPLEKRDFSILHVPSEKNVTFFDWTANLFDIILFCRFDFSEIAKILETTSSHAANIIKKNADIWRAFSEQKTAFQQISHC